MEIEVNGKLFILNDDPRLGVLMELEKHPNSMDTIWMFFKEILVPSPTDKEIKRFRQSDLGRIFQAWGDLQRENIAETKKKLS